jgi:hypothetical protein
LSLPANIHNGEHVKPSMPILKLPPFVQQSNSERAVDAFTKTFLPRSSPMTVTPPKRPGMVEHLPVELLAIIFGLVYDQEILEPSDSLCPEWQDAADIVSPSLFPYAIASVCSFWRDVASLVPNFWTRVVILY